MQRSIIARVRIGSSADTDVTIRSGHSRAEGRLSQETTDPPNFAASSAAWSAVRFSTRNCLNSAVAQVPHDLLAVRARSHDQRSMGIQLAEDSLSKLHASEGHRDGPRSDFRLRANALADFESPLKHPLEHRTRRAMVQRDAVGFAHLS